MLENETFDQLYIMACDRKLLERTGTREVTVNELVSMGMIPAPKPGEPMSLVQKIRRDNALEAERLRKMSKRDRRREQARLLAESRARGEA